MSRIPAQSVRRRRLAELAAELGHEFRRPELLDRALCHSSMGNDGKASYERLEFLGDSILGFLVADYLYRLEPEVPEGELTDRRATIVSRRPLAKIAKGLGLTSYVEVGRGLRVEELESPRIHADLVEAVIGAIYLDGGIRAARKFVRRHVIRPLDKPRASGEGPRDAKSRLLHLAQTNNLGQPEYEVIATDGPDHQRTFTVAAIVADEEWGRGRAGTKQAAGMAAAVEAVEQLRAHLERDDEVATDTER